ncbi:NADH-quinone oxidoreductase subunit L [Rariglobus hedericola]|uniref:NADH-quinone oxidoreductase subunit L n=1 Tax=Rariglobus hedericola TaxID=2597822 RepID=A0A556QKD9_9BACT|nr:NADH-quinone oxidoreductase subunit L [Rariglobus hedericola]TSJ77123.1 NADH-quinone oxidoreductase subunit L [Rariglobus hedericola]
MSNSVFGYSPTVIALLTLLTPLASALVIALFFRRAGGIAALVSTFTAAIIAAGGLTLAFGGYRDAAVDASAAWLSLGSFTLSLGIKFDDLSALMISIVGVVGLCVHVFSLGYMHDDEAKARYFGGLSIFMFSMLGIVLADNLFMIFIFWELVGFSSYVLINHYHTKQTAADASKKAFITNRVGDFGFLLGIIGAYYAFGTVNLTEIAAISGAGASYNIIALLLFCGAVGKSAQVPLHVWLPDAMEGPTPVSALIHAATMVAAGIFMLCRIEPLFAAAPIALNVVTWIGAITALYAALCAITQSDIKKVLAYSTLSQLGYMVAAFGLGRLELVPHGEVGQLVLISAGAGAAMFHLTTHAFFKALMFLGSGSVIHGCHHEQDIFKMGGLSKKMPLTFITFTIGVAAIAGLPFLSGFYSKDAILHLAQEKNYAVFVVLFITAILTSFYMVRMWKLVFLGAPRSDDASHAHEGGISMTLPLVVLAVLAVVAGYTTHEGGGLIYGDSFKAVWSQIPHAEGLGVYVMSIVILAVGAGAAFALYKPAAADSLAAKSPVLFAFLSFLKGSFDGAYNWYVAKVQQRFALILEFLERVFLSGLIIRGAAGVVGLVGLGARALHVGSLHAYVYWFLFGAAVLWAFAGGWLN